MNIACLRGGGVGIALAEASNTKKTIQNRFIVFTSSLREKKSLKEIK